MLHLAMLLLALVCLAFACLALACCVVAGRADDAAERLRIERRKDAVIGATMPYLPGLGRRR